MGDQRLKKIFYEIGNKPGSENNATGIGDQDN